MGNTNRIPACLMVSVGLMLAADASGQSSSLYLRAEQGEFGSNRPNVVVIIGGPLRSPTRTASAEGSSATETSARATGAGPATTGRAADETPTTRATPTIAASGQPAIAPAQAAIRPGAGQLRPYPMLTGTRAGASVSPAMAALQRASFTAIAPPTPRQFQVHDLVTIVVREVTTFSSDGESDLEKTYTLEAKLEKWIKLRAGNMQIVPTAMADGTPQIKGSGTRKLEGEGEIKRKDSFIGRLTAEVLDVKPNGTLVLSARKFIKTDDEEQFFELTGTCRAEDVNADNTVLSTQLADLTVRKTHKGAVRDTTKRGILPWLVDKINPW